MGFVRHMYQEWEYMIHWSAIALGSMTESFWFLHIDKPLEIRGSMTGFFGKYGQKCLFFKVSLGQPWICCT